MARKLFTFKDPLVDRQFIEILDAINGTPPGGILIPDPVTLKKYLIVIDSSSGTPQLAIIEQ